MKRIIITLVCISALSGCFETSETTLPKPTKNKKDLSVLTVGTLYGAQSYISTGQGYSGFDYDLADKFAKFLGVDLYMQPYISIDDLYTALQNGDIDIIAAGLADTPERRKHFRIGPTLYDADQVLVYRQGARPSKNLWEIKGITVVANSSFVETLNALKNKHPQLAWQTIDDKDSEEILAMIDDGELNYSITDSTTLDINRRYMPELRQGITLIEDQPIVWLLRATDSDILMSKLLAFWHQQQQAGTLEHLDEKYFGHVKRFDYVDTRAFIRAVNSKLPKYQPLFENYAGELDWRKLAATSYQESHWNPHARSPLEYGE